MACVLDAYDLDTYAYGCPEWENAMADEYNSSVRNKTSGLVPRSHMHMHMVDLNGRMLWPMNTIPW
jgi:hypothetical protein